MVWGPWCRSLAGEERIIADVLAGKTSEFRKLVEQYQRPIFRFVRNLIGDDHDAEDITQDVFLTAFNKLSSYNVQRSSLVTWLFTIARNRCINHLKRKRPVLDGEIVKTKPLSRDNDMARNEFWIRRSG